MKYANSNHKCFIAAVRSIDESHSNLVTAMEHVDFLLTPEDSEDLNADYLELTRKLAAMVKKVKLLKEGYTGAVLPDEK